MSYRTKQFKLLPWIGGTNTSLDPSVIEPGQLTKAENILFGTRGSRNMRDGINFNWDGATNGGESIVGLCDFWYGSSGVRVNALVGVGSSGNLYSYDKGTGARTLVPLNSTATAWGNFNGVISFEVMNNALIYAGDGTGNVPRFWKGSASSATDLSSNVPQISVMREHLGRLWSNDKTIADRINYSPPGDPTSWLGLGDSGALDIGVGDGDPVGITAIFPSFQGNLYVSKATKLYQISGTTPETFAITTISDGIGCVGANAVASIDHEDLVFVSSRGIHSLLGTVNFGDQKDKYLSKDIQLTINNSWTPSLRKYIWAAYLSNINSVAFSVPDSTYSGTTSGNNTAIWIYNIPLQSWYVWPNISCQSLIVATDSDQRRFYIGTNVNRVGKTFNGTNYDVSTTNTNTDITMNVVTGIIYLDPNPLVVCAIKRFTLIYGPKGTHTIVVTIKIDNYSPQSLSFSQVTGAKLGSSFILGSSTLGYSFVTGPYSQTIDGYGRAVQVSMSQSGQQANVEIQGFAIEYEPLGPMQETILSG